MKHFDCYDFYLWTSGKFYDFSDFETPKATLYLSELEELIHLNENFQERNT